MPLPGLCIPASSISPQIPELLLKLLQGSDTALDPLASPNPASAAAWAQCSSTDESWPTASVTTVYYQFATILRTAPSGRS